MILQNDELKSKTPCAKCEVRDICIGSDEMEKFVVGTNEALKQMNFHYGDFQITCSRFVPNTERLKGINVVRI